jgi:hypothetical protein
MVEKELNLSQLHKVQLQILNLLLKVEKVVKVKVKKMLSLVS